MNSYVRGTFKSLTTKSSMSQTNIIPILKVIFDMIFNLFSL